MEHDNVSETMEIDTKYTIIKDEVDKKEMAIIKKENDLIQSETNSKKEKFLKVTDKVDDVKGDKLDIIERKDGDSIDENSLKESKAIGDNVKGLLQETSVEPEWRSHLRVEEVTGSSAEEDSADQTEENDKRRKKKTKMVKPESETDLKKIQEILSVLGSSPLDVENLRQLAISNGGLVKDELRRKAWPCLMMLEQMECTPKPTTEVVKAHKDYNQVLLDVNRSLKRFPPGIDEEYRVVLMDQLTTLIIRVLMKHPHLHYYQGYHDVAITFLLVMGEEVGYALVEKLSVTHLYEFMKPTMEKTTYYLTYIYPILRRSHEDLYDFLMKSGVGTIFCLPWLITWYAHTLSDYRNVVRLYDFFLASPYLMPMYIAAAIVIHRKDEVLAGECDMAMQHFILSQVPDSLPFESILIEASRLYEAHHPDTLTEEVEEFNRKKAQEDLEERKRATERKRRYQAAKRGSNISRILATVSYYIPANPVYKQAFKVAAFAFSAYLATNLYTYYSNNHSFHFLTHH